MAEIDIDNLIDSIESEMKESLEHLQKELTKLRAGKANPSMLAGIMVEYYGNPTPLNQVANVNASDGRTLNITPWEKSIIGDIEGAIFAANLGLTPQNNGEMIIINIPALTEERRKELVKQAKSKSEDARVSIRSARHKGMDGIKNAVKDGYPEDAGKREEDRVQKLTDSYNNKVTMLFQAKEEDIMKV